MILKLNNLIVSCIIGDLPFEREQEQELSLDIELTVDDKIGKTDSLEDGVDYASLSDEIRKLLIAEKCRLIERAAHIVADLCIKKNHVISANVSVTKKGALPYLESASACANQVKGIFPEYELPGIEVIARGVCIQNDEILLCKAKGSSTTYLPGGHIEFGEDARTALKREMQEEAGIDIKIGKFLGCVENSFLQHGKPHSEINFVFDFEVADHNVKAQESHIEFVWWKLSELNSANLLPNDFVRLANGGNIKFEI